MNDKEYARYGDRGITVCDRWREFRNFADDMPERPKPWEDWSIDRIDNDGNYEPRNVRWATKIQQTRNTRRADEFTNIDGISHNKRHWLRCKRDGLCYKCGEKTDGKRLCLKHLQYARQYQQGKRDAMRFIRDSGL